MAVPLLLSFIAIVAGAVFAYGTDPMWARYAHGMDIIMWSRRLQWLSASIAIVMSVGLIALVTLGRRRAWWLLALGPVLALFLHGMSGGPTAKMTVLDSPKFVAAPQADFLCDEDWVVGVLFNGKAYAYPYSSLYYTPMVIQSDHDKHMLLMWSAFANRACAFAVRYDLKGRDFDIVSMPANSLLIYNARRGQFIHGFSGLTPKGETPWGFHGSLPVFKCTWRKWRDAQPKTVVLVTDTAPRQSVVPCEPLQPQFPVPHQLEKDAAKRVALISTTRPVAIPNETVGDEPLNLTAGTMSILMVREALTGRPGAFLRELEQDQPAKFGVNTSARIKGDLMDNVAHSGWKIESAAGDPPLMVHAIDGPRKGQKLWGMPVDTDLPWEVVQTFVIGVTYAEVPKPVKVTEPPPVTPLRTPRTPPRRH